MEENNIEKLEEVIKNKKKVGGDFKNKINGKVFENIILAIIFTIYFYLLYLGAQNIETTSFVLDLKVFSVGFLAVSIIIFEISYKKENGSLAIHGIEVLILALITLFLIYTYSLFVNRTFFIIISIISMLDIVYFLIKSCIIAYKMKKQYIKGKDDIKEIIKK